MLHRINKNIAKGQDTMLKSVANRYSEVARLTLFSEIRSVPTKSTRVYGMHMCGDKIVRVRESFMNNRGFFKYVCLDFTLYCMVFHWIFLIRAVVVIFFS